MPLPHLNPLNKFPNFTTNEEKIELDLNNPVFVVYVNTQGLSTQSREESLWKTKKMFDIYKNATFWVISSDETKVECVYDGQCRSRDMEISDLIEEINTRIDIMSKSSSFEDFKINIRDWRINELVNGSQEK